VRRIGDEAAVDYQPALVRRIGDEAAVDHLPELVRPAMPPPCPHIRKLRGVSKRPRAG
jgi:hypothetical protein